MTRAATSVGLFVSCPVDLLRPSVGFAAVKLLEEAGCTVEVPPQSCCGQVAFNNGDPAATRRLAWQLVRDFEQYDYVVVPSGSCGSTIKQHYPELFRNDERLPRVQRFCEKVHELTLFLDQVVAWQPGERSGNSTQRFTYHDSCAGLRELGIKTSPRRLLQRVGVEVVEMQDTEICCGFGGTFCVKFSGVSTKMVDDKVRNIRNVGADCVLGGDVSCLLHIAGRMHRQQGGNPAHKPVQARHLAEVLAGDLAVPAIGESGENS